MLEDAPVALFSSGMAAHAAAVLTTVKAGDTVLLLSDGYYAVRNLMDEVLTGFGVTVTTRPTAGIDTVPLDGVKLVIVETPTNPHLDVIDLAALSERCRTACSILAVDNTVCTALPQQPLDLGADLVIVSDTKSASGHSDLLLGHVARIRRLDGKGRSRHARWPAPSPAPSMLGYCCAVSKRWSCGWSAWVPPQSWSPSF